MTHIKLPRRVPLTDAHPPMIKTAVQTLEERKRVKELLEQHLKTKHSAWEKHQSAMLAEAALNRSGTKAIHGHIRHGWQTGWLGQLVRIVTHRPPDQPNDPMGLKPTIRTWKTTSDFKLQRKGAKDLLVAKDTMMRLDKKGQTEVVGQSPVPKVKPAKSGGKSAGVFHNPESQNEAVEACMAEAAKAAVFTTCEVKLLNGSTAWVPFSFVYVEITGRSGGFGVAFEREADFVDIEEDEVLQAVDDWLRWQTLGDCAKRANKPEPQDAKKYRFASWGEVLKFLKVRQLGRNGAHAEISLDEARKPTLFTVFPVSVALGQEGWAPGGFVVEKQQKKDYDGCKWTGGLRNAQSVEMRVTPPAWALED